MALFGKTENVNVRDLITDNELRPPEDRRYSELLGKGLRGETEVYLAHVPLCLCVPSDLDFRMDRSEVGKQVLAAVIEQGRNNQFTYLWVYQRGWWFVVADDYPNSSPPPTEDPKLCPAWC